MKKEYLKFLEKGAFAGDRYSLNLSSSSKSGISGSRFSKTAGNSMEFREHRDYLQGDDLRFIDWGVYARTDKLAIKTYQNEISPCVDIVLDTSKSMKIGSNKVEASLGLAALFARASENAKYHFKTWATVDEFYPVENGTKFAPLWENINFSSTRNLSEMNSSNFYNNGVRILITDLLWDGEPGHFLTKFANCASSVIVVQVLSQEDKKPAFLGDIELQDSENGTTDNFHISESVLKDYDKALTAHLANWNKACRERGIIMTSLIASEITENWLLDDLLKYEVLRFF